MPKGKLHGKLAYSQTIHKTVKSHGVVAMRTDPLVRVHFVLNTGDL